MEKENRRNFLKGIFSDILINNITESNIEKITKCLREYLDNEDWLNDIENNYMLLNIMMLIKNNMCISSALMLYIKELEIKILRLTSEKLVEDTSEMEEHIELPKELAKACDNNYLSQYKHLLRDRYIPTNDNFILPKKGEIGNLKVFEQDPATGIRYKMEVLVDSEGRVVGMINEPVALEMKNKSFDEIYGGLLNEILMFSENEMGD